MVLFVGVEMTSGGRIARKGGLAGADDRRGSLRERWNKPATTKVATRQSPAKEPARKKNLQAQRAPHKKTSSEREEPKVVLGPLLETDPAGSESEAVRDRRVPAFVAADRHKVEFLAEPDAVSGKNNSDSRDIEARLAGIQQHLDRLGSAIAAQAERNPPVDAVKQTAELLKLLREARDSEPKSSAQPAELTDQKTDDATQKPVAGDKGGKREKAAKDYDADVVAEKQQPQPETKIYRPRYLSGSALQALVAPLLTSEIGKAGATDAGTDESALAGGGDSSPAPISVLVVRDFPEILRKIDRLVMELDVPPTPVKIEATVITVRLDEGRPQGIDLQEFNSTGRAFAILPADGFVSGAQAAGDAAAVPGYAGLAHAADGTQLTHGFGLKCGVLQGDPRAFISALQSVVQMRRANAWQINVLNRQSAQFVLNDPYAAQGGAAQGPTGTILKVRPIVTADGIVHLDVRRDSDLDAGATGNRSAALTHQIALREGQTAIVGGFFAEHLAAYTYSTPGFGSLPLVGKHFRKQVGMVDRSETIVLLTPHVAHPVAELPGVAVRKGRPKSLPKGRPILKETAATSRLFGHKDGPPPLPGLPIPPEEKAPAAEPDSIQSSRPNPLRRAAVDLSCAPVQAPRKVDLDEETSEPEPPADSQPTRRNLREDGPARIRLTDKEALSPELPDPRRAASSKPPRNRPADSAAVPSRTTVENTPTDAKSPEPKRAVYPIAPHILSREQSAGSPEERDGEESPVDESESGQTPGSKPPRNVHVDSGAVPIPMEDEDMDDEEAPQLHESKEDGETEGTEIPAEAEAPEETAAPEETEPEDDSIPVLELPGLPETGPVPPRN